MKTLKSYIKKRKSKDKTFAKDFDKGYKNFKEGVRHISSPRLEKIDGDLQKKLENKEFRRLYEIERAKIALPKKGIMINDEDQITMLKIKSLLNHLDYIIKDDHKKVVDDYHTVCRKYCSWGKVVKVKPAKS